MADEPRFEGTEMTIAGKKYVIPAMNLKRLKKQRPNIDLLRSMSPGPQMTEEEIGVMVEIIHAALSRNYPDLTVDDVEEMVDLNNIRPISMAVMGASGFVPAGGQKAGSEER
jgi:hypothetical protein